MKSSKDLKSLYLKRLKRAEKILSLEKIDAFYLTNPIDLFYFTGMELSTGWLIIGKSSASLFVDGRYIQVAIKKSPFPVELYNEETLLAFLNKKKVKKCGCDGSIISFDAALSFQKKLQKNGISLVSKSSFCQTLRSIKDEHEIKAIKKSCKLLWKGYQHIQSVLQVGITEKELALEFEKYCKEHKAEKLSFDPIIAFGSSSAMPHYHPGNRRLKRGDVVLIDIGVVVDNYCSDMTRVLFFGPPNKTIERFYEIVKKAQAAALGECRPGVLIGKLDEAARKVMQEENVEELFVHSLGHGLGLEVHEYPRISSKGGDKNQKLSEGMVITIEPGLYLPDVGGVRYEDMFLITKNGYQRFFPQERA